MHRIVRGVGVLILLVCATSVLAAEAKTKVPIVRGGAKQSDMSSAEKYKQRRAAIEQKLDTILANQRTILQQSEAVKEELAIVKVRATTSARTLVLQSGSTCP